MWALTVDTNVIRDYAEPHREGHNIAKELVELHDAGMCEIRLTTRFDADVPGGPLRTKLEALSVLENPKVGTVFRLDVSRLDSGDMIASEESAKEADELMALLFPSAKPESDRHRNRMADVDHLMGHKIAGRDIFVTNEKAILNQREALSAKFGITVMSPGEAAEKVSPP